MTPFVARYLWIVTGSGCQAFQNRFLGRPVLITYFPLGCSVVAWYIDHYCPWESLPLRVA